MSKESHLERTAGEPRDPSLHAVTIKHIDQISDTIRIFTLEIPEGAPTIRFLPGQWADTYCPSLPKPGGFTLTSAPSLAAPCPPARPRGTLELAVRASPDNPAAQHLWTAPAASLLGTSLRLRIGGAFVYPPPGVAAFGLRKLVFVAGGLGVNPLVAMVGYLAGLGGRAPRGVEVRFLYGLRDPGGSGEGRAAGMLFVERLAGVFARGEVKGRLKLFLTGGEGKGGEEGQGEEVVEEGVVTCKEAGDVPFVGRRITVADVAEAVGEDRRFAAVYVCGVPDMTDEFVAKLVAPVPQGVGMERHRVLFEKWW